MYVGLRFFTSFYLGFLILHLRLIYIHIYVENCLF